MLLIWGKWTGLAEPLPLLAHMLDTSAVALIAWDHVSPQVRQNATDIFSPGNGALARARFAVLAGVHDCGKASREFSGQAWSKHREQFAMHRERLAAAGLPMDMPSQQPALGELERLWLRHEAVSGLILHDQTTVPAWARRVVMGHHGRYQLTGAQRNVARELDELRARTADPAWAMVQQTLLQDLVVTVSRVACADANLSSWPAELAGRLVPFLVALTGLVCVCDWIASDEAFTGSSPRHLLAKDDLDGYLRLRLVDAEAALDGVLLGSGTPVGEFAELFRGRVPRGAVQTWAAGRRHAPGLTIVMAPMGEGKTEVALRMHSTDGSVAPGVPAGDGLFFGLPTMATADAMFARVQEFWDGTKGTGKLTHSLAILHDFYAPSNLRPAGICGAEHETADGADRDGLQPVDWFNGRHRGLLAPVTVGTCDQVLAAALDHKFLQVRLAALSGKHVVLDEVHTYDPYQHVLLCRLLGWLGAFRCRVTILSATLPRARVEQLVSAWTRGWQACPTSAVVEEVLAELPAELPYPSVVTVRDGLVCEPLGAWRVFDLEVHAQVMSANKDELLADTIALVRNVRQEQPDARIGLIVNTVDRSIALYEALAVAEAGECVLLHSRMTAGQRRARTERLHALLGPDAPAGPVLMVATQVAEASLDLDLDVLITDLAPMASLLQRTGRLWRHSVNVGGGWSHPANLARRTGNPVVHVLAPVNADGLVAAGFAALPYTTAELRQTWSQPSCLDRGARTVFHVPADMQPAIDAAHLTLQDLADHANLEPDDAQQVLRHLAGEVVKANAAHHTGHQVREIARPWAQHTEEDPWGRSEPDWSRLTAPTLWDDANGVVTRLREREQAQLLLYDATGQTPWAWHGDPATLDKHTTRETLLTALNATVPVGGGLAARLRAAATTHLPDRWLTDAPALLRGLTPVPVTALAGIAALDSDLGLIRVETA